MEQEDTLRGRLKRGRRRKRLRLLRLVITVAALCYAAHWTWGFIHSTGFAFGSVSIHGTGQLTEKDVLELAGSGEPCNLFNVSSSRLRDALKHDVRFKNSEVAYRLPATLQVTVEEREPALYVANAYHSYLKLDYTGVVLSVTTGIPDAKAPVLVGAQCGNVYIGDTVANETVLNILKFLQQLDGEALERIGEIAVDDKQEVKLRLMGSFPILLGKQQELPKKAQVFMTVFNEIKDKNIKAEYIDLTFAKPYIKLLNNKDK